MKSWAVRKNISIGDIVLDFGLGWNAHCPIWRVPPRFWWRYPVDVQWHRTWGRTSVILWPLGGFVGWYTSHRHLRGLTYTQMKWRIHAALQELVKEQEERAQ